MNELTTSDSVIYANRENIMSYAGAISRIRGACEMVMAMAVLADDMNVQLIMAGKHECADLEKSLQQTSGYGRFRVKNRLSRDKIAMLFAESKLGLVLVPPSPNRTESQPNKLFEYVPAGIPDVASDFPL